MNSNKKIARVAGLLYLLVGIFGAFNMMYVPAKLIVWEDAAMTASNIMASDLLFRFGIVSGLIAQLLFILLPLLFYKLLKSVNQNCALIMVVVAMIGIPIAMFNLLNEYAAIQLLSGAQYLKVLETEQLQAQMMLSLDLYKNGILIAQIFWGLWLFPLGYLVFKSHFFSKILGILLMIGCFGYLVGSFTGLLFSHNKPLETFSLAFSVISSLAEFSLILWLLIKGVKDSRSSKEGVC